MNHEQSNAFEAFKRGDNIFLTGSAGTGKSFTLKHIITYAKSIDLEIGITASTGSAAYLLRGRTIHSFLGVGLATKSAEALAMHVIKKNHLVYKKLKNLDVLLIDEISMIDAEFFDKISEFLCLIRNNPQPFGGIQLVISGDFCQLPPVKGKHCFQSNVWSTAGINTIMLETLVRQDGDIEFQNILKDVRWGKCSKETLIKLKGLKATEFNNGITPTLLYSTNVDVDCINTKEYEKLIATGAQQKRYHTQHSPSSSTAAKTWGSHVKIPEYVDVCIGAQVMVTWNLPSDVTIINGTRGVVTHLDDSGPTIKLLSGRSVKIDYLKLSSEDNDNVCIHFIPLRLAYAVTIHKSQGCTLDAVEIDLGGSIFEYGQAYTALSRARNMASIKIVKIRAKSFITHPLVKKFYGVETSR